MESITRLYQAYKSDRYIQDILKRMRDFMAYHTTPFERELPEQVKVYQQMIDCYTKSQYPWLLPTYVAPKSDLAIAMSWCMMEGKERKILSTKKKCQVSVLDGIDIRLTLYTIYQREWIDYTSWDIISPKDIFFKLMLRNYLEPFMTFNQWLYKHGYEDLLDDREFIAVINELDEIYQSHK